LLKKTPDSLLENPDLRPRLLTAGAVVFAALLLLCLRLWHLQATEGEHFRALSENNRLRLKWMAAPRGIIYDHKGRVLVDNRPSFDVVVVPEDAPDLETTLSSLALHLSDGKELANGVLPRDPRRPPYEGVVVKQDVDWPTLVAVETHQPDIPGVSIEVQPKRRYPANGSAAHLLGYVGEVSPAELTLLSNYRMGEVIGKFGTEKQWDKYLHGQRGFQNIEVDSMGRRLRMLKEIEAQSGFDLVLTLDWDIQSAAEEAMTGKEGTLVVLDPRDGAVLAMVSRPAFDPNIFARGIRPEEWQELTTSSLHPLTNRAIQGQYPPGSSFKIVLAVAALEKGEITPSTRFFCPGGFWFGGHFFHCWRKGGHGGVDLRRALVESCNVYFYQVGQRLGVDTIAAYARKLGLGLPSGIALDHERGGVIPDSAWKKKVLGAPWYAGETLSVAIGQGYVSVTPLQMATLAAAIANGGTVYRPYLVRRVQTAEGEVVREYHPEAIQATGIGKKTLDFVRQAMQDVVNSPSGTGKKAQLPNVIVAGKTGTAQAVPGLGGKGTKLPRRYRDHAWFVAFAPVQDSEVAVACLIEHAGEGGGAAAAPVVRQVLEKYFASSRGREDVRQEAHLTF
jgi:penicillin-binding protein 2